MHFFLWRDNIRPLSPAVYETETQMWKQTRNQIPFIGIYQLFFLPHDKKVYTKKL